MRVAVIPAEKVPRQRQKQAERRVRKSNLDAPAADHAVTVKERVIVDVSHGNRVRVDSAKQRVERFFVEQVNVNRRIGHSPDEQRAEQEVARQ